eukprot:5763567-Amphidinium_carterae.1
MVKSRRSPAIEVGTPPKQALESSWADAEVGPGESSKLHTGTRTHPCTTVRARGEPGGTPGQRYRNF